MSVASEITALTADRDDIRAALVDQGISGASSHGFDDFAADIAAISGSSPTQSKTATPSLTQQVIQPDAGYLLSSVTVEAMPEGSAGTPTASKGSVSNHSVQVTPSVQNTAGYISGGTETGTPVTVTAAELVSGSETKTENGTFDVTNLAELVVNVPTGGGSYTLLGEKDVTANTTGTSATSLDSITVGAAAWTKAKMIYVRIRDKAGPRAGYFYGSDNIFINYNLANSSTTAITTAGRLIHRYSTSSQWGLYSGATSTGYGVYAYDINNSGRVRIYTRYNSTNSLTINGTYHVEVYALDWPDGVSPYD